MMIAKPIRYETSAMTKTQGRETAAGGGRARQPEGGNEHEYIGVTYRCRKTWRGLQAWLIRNGNDGKVKG
jgi:hypothetical protein